MTTKGKLPLYLSLKDLHELIGLKQKRTQITRYYNDKKYAHLGFPKPGKIGDRLYWPRWEIFDFLKRNGLPIPEGEFE
jgi:predicted DNA-binding transcriptional regulator AlpA